MLPLLTDRDEFAIGASMVGVAAAVLATVTATGWGIPLLGSLIVLMALRARWRTMPTWLLLLWTAVAVIPSEAADLSGSSYFVGVVALLLAAAYGMNRLETVMAAGLMLSPFALWAAGVPDFVDFGPWTWTAGLGLGWLFGAVVARQWELIDELTETRSKLAAAAVDAERQRIAREMHDVVGHSFSVVLLHLSGARAVLESNPDDAAEALRRAEDVGRRGMEDLRHTIGLMHSGDDELPSVPDTADLDALIEDYRAAGMSIATTLDPAMDAVAGAARIVTHDVVRESLTNCAKHAPDAEVHVVVAVSDICVDVRIENSFSSASPGDDGVGLVGLRQRVEALDGVFHASQVGSSWVVRAEIPRERRVADAAPSESKSTSTPAASA